MPAPPAQQVPAVYHRRVGDITVTALGDGAVLRTHEMMNDVPEDRADALLADAFRTEFLLSITCFLIWSGGRVALVDTGGGDYLGSGAGHLSKALAAAGVAPGDIDTILLTHMHPDHSAGLTDRAAGQAIYPNAELVVHENEPAYWFDEAQMAAAPDRAQELGFRQAQDQCAPYRDRMRTFTGGEVFPGVTAIPCFGHTPGHTGFLVASAGQSLLIWGDIVHMPEVQVANPEVTMTVDIDPSGAHASRLRIFDMAATDQLPVTGMHLHYPGFGHVGRRGDTYRFVPEPWLQEI